MIPGEPAPSSPARTRPHYGPPEIYLGGTEPRLNPREIRDHSHFRVRADLRRGERRGGRGRGGERRGGRRARGREGRGRLRGETGCRLRGKEFGKLVKQGQRRRPESGGKDAVVLLTIHVF